MSFKKPDPEPVTERSSWTFCTLLPPGSTLQDNLHFMHKILDAFPFPVFVKNTQRQYIACNLAFEEFIGTNREEILGKTALQCGHQDLDYMRGKAADDLYNNLGMQTDEITVVTGDGTKRDAFCNKYVFLNEDGTPGGVIGSIFDVTGHKQTKGLLENLRFLQTLIDTIPCPIFYKDTEGIYLGCNKAFEKYMNKPREEIIGRTDRHLVPKILAEKYTKADRKLLKNKVPRTYEASIMYGDGTRHDVICNKAVFHKPDGTTGGLVGSILDITERKKFEQQLMYQANHDSLTGLPNRNLLNDRLSHALAYENRHRELLAVLLIDLDNFKVVNDTFGHSCGDVLLLEVANRLRISVRQYDTVARLGGDEFVIMMTDTETIQNLAKVCDKIMASFKEPFLIGGQEVFTTASIGIATYPNDGVTADALLKNADTAMYDVKERGRNGYQFFTEEMNTRVQERLAIETKLRKALEKFEFFLLYQPRMDVASGRIAGVEALLRWQTEDGGVVMPADFIPLLEETGLIVPVGEWVLQEVCTQGRKWLDAGLPPLIISVNVSARQFHQQNLPQKLGEILDATGFLPQYMEIELTESIIIQDVEDTIVKLDRLKKMGVRLSIDDFGTGYSSLNYLKRLPIDILKIDRSFVNGLANDPDDATIVSTIIAMAHNLNMNVVAEGVEDNKQLQFVDQHGCKEVQGFLFSRPVAADRIVQMLLYGNI